ncbi:MAG: hypothetical protein HY290_20655, partial [Planctomycetia bacterium]|nr:hypothetical protein [Planctomycetia bacterium]
NASDGAAVAILINKASSTTTTIGAGPFTYDGSTHTGGSGTVTGAGGLSTSATSLTYSGDQVNAGTYYVTAHYAGDANHNASDGAAIAIVIKAKSLNASAWSQGTVNIGSNGAIVLHIAVDAGQLYNSDTIASLFNGATFTVQIRKSDGSISYGTLTSVAKVETDGSITVTLQMSNTLRAELYAAYVSGGAVDFHMTATSKNGNYYIDEDAMSRLLNNGALKYVV